MLTTRRPPPTQLAGILPSVLLSTVVHQAGAWLEKTRSVPQPPILSPLLLWSGFKLKHVLLSLKWTECLPRTSQAKLIHLTEGASSANGEDLNLLG